MIILATYLALGIAISFVAGREPGTPPEDALRELAPSVLVIAAFLTHYQLVDVMGVGTAKRSFENDTARLHHGDYAARSLHCSVYLAQRAQTNQVEQLPVFVLGTLGCAWFVDGRVAALLAAAWVGIRIRYAAAYRDSAGLTHGETMARIARYTVPAYFISTSMVTATGVHALRCLL